jgi:ATP-dependent Clp protease ATP-binding subunit ClpA
MKEHSVRLIEEETLAPPSPFKNYPIIMSFIDILSRQERHHLLLQSSSSRKIQNAIIQGLVQTLRSAPVPKTLQDAEFIYFDAIRFAQNMEDDLLAWSLKPRKENQRTVLIINQMEILFHSKAKKWLDSILLDESWRVIVFTKKTGYQNLLAQRTDLSDLFTFAEWDEQNEIDMLATLKYFGTEFENFHQVNIPDEIFSSAISMASHYLPGASWLEKTLELLDSACARATAINNVDQEKQPLVTSKHLSQVVSNFTKIPLTHLQNNYFKAAHFIKAMQQSVFGQDAALSKIGTLLQNACIKLQKKSGPLCSLLLTGPSGVGKTKLAFSMAEHLFGHNKAIVQVNPNALSSLYASIQQMPYAIVLLKNVEELSLEVLNIFKDILLQGYIIDAENNKHDFQHALIIMTTTLGADSIADHFSQEQSAPETEQSNDLMQLVLNTSLQETTIPLENISPEKMYDDVYSTLKMHFSAEFLRCLNIIPFIPLDYIALEKLMRLKLNSLAKQLDARFGIELHYASEVIKFLSHESLYNRINMKSFGNLLDQHLYACVTREVLAYAEDKNKSKQLLLELNDNGQLLRCRFITTNEVPLFK